MSGQHWIDAFFRKRLGRRDFPVEEGEFDAVRALLHQRNSTTQLVRGGGFSKWWLTALLPMAGLLWWTVGEKRVGLDQQTSAITAERAVTGSDVAEQHHAVAGDSNAHIEPDVSFGTGRKGGALHGTPATSIDEQMTAVNNASDEQARPKDDVRTQQAAGTRGPVAETVDTPDPRVTDESVDGEQGSTQDARNRMSQDQLASNATVIDAEEGSPRVTLPGSIDHVGIAQDADAPSTSAMTEAGLVPVRSASEAVGYMKPRWPEPVGADAQAPEQRIVEVFKRVPTGELQAYAGPLFVRTRSGAGGRSAAEAGSIVGLEYRVRSKRLSWATGIHYGSYALKADQGATDVKLSYVELPLLASVRLGRGRFGALVQGGLSVDLLFNSSGRYPVGEDRSSTGFPDGAFRTANCSWSFRPQAVFHVTEYLSVNAGPLWKAQFGKVAEVGPLDHAKISSSGLTIGITWRLDRATF